MSVWEESCRGGPRRDRSLPQEGGRGWRPHPGGTGDAGPTEELEVSAGQFLGQGEPKEGQAWRAEPGPQGDGAEASGEGGAVIRGKETRMGGS